MGCHPVAQSSIVLPLPLIVRALLSSLILTALLAACGYKAPLYLPKPKPEAQPQTSPAAQEPKKDAAPSQ